ncbi:putative NADH:ubiquinone reductase [Tanacetum coccineum]
MEEQLLNPHYNQSKCSPDRYMMLNGDQDRERGLAPLLALRDKSTHMNGANSHVPSSLVWFREPPLGWSGMRSYGKEYITASLIREFLMIAVFRMLDPLLFYVLPESVLIPMLCGAEHLIFAGIKLFLCRGQALASSSIGARVGDCVCSREGVYDAVKSVIGGAGSTLAANSGKGCYTGRKKLGNCGLLPCRRRGALGRGDLRLSALKQLGGGGSSDPFICQNMPKKRYDVGAAVAGPSRGWASSVQLTASRVTRVRHHPEKQERLLEFQAEKYMHRYVVYDKGDDANASGRSRYDADSPQ